MHLKRLFVGLLALVFTSLALPALAAPPTSISYTVGVCDPWFPSRCTQAGPFVPDAVSTAQLAVTAVTASVALPGSGQTVILTNNGTADISVKLGGSTVSATSGDFFLGAGRSVAILRGTATYVAALTASGSSTLVAETGNGTAPSGGGGSSGSAITNYALETGGNLAASKTDLDSLVAAAANPAGILGTNGTTIASSTNPLDVTARGPAASGATASGNPLLDGCRASTAVPTAVTDGQAVAARCSKLGNFVTSTWAPRDLQGDQATTITSSTAAASCLTAGAANIFRDIVSITANNSSGTDTVVQLLDADGTTVRWTGTAKANDMRGIVFPQPLKGVNSAAAWDCKTVTSVASVVFTIQYFETK